MEKLPFEYSYFEQRVSASVTAARSSTATSVHPEQRRRLTQLAERTSSATVAGVAEENQFDAAAITSIQAKLAEDNLFNYATEDLKGCYGRLDSAAIAGYKARDVQRWANEDEKAQEEAESWADFADDIAGP
ncbi:hypothetical protein KEM48_011069 [Puccinia striiformis f. sp. tritici PST-130]|nr:hypothetical protein KEM48_011069 [Puccinia striiformis f. sp. tritici PST-130]